MGIEEYQTTFLNVQSQSDYHTIEAGNLSTSFEKKAIGVLRGKLQAIQLKFHFDASLGR